MENKRMRKLFSELSERQKRRRIVACLENSNSDIGSSSKTHDSVSHKRVKKMCGESDNTTGNSNSSLSIRTSEDYVDMSSSSQLPQSIVLARTAEQVISRPNHCCCEEVMELIKKLERKVDKLTKIMLKNDEASQKPPVGSVPVMPPAAKNLEELKILASHPQLIDMLKPFVGINTGDTIRRILKRVMSRDLAVQFSYTGLGKNRQREKKEFRVHPLCVRIIDGAAELGLKAKKAELVQCIQAALRGARDWHGKRRSTMLKVTSGIDDDAS